MWNDPRRLVIPGPANPARVAIAAWVVLCALGPGCRAGQDEAASERDGGPGDDSRPEAAGVAAGCWGAPPAQTWAPLPSDDVPPPVRQGIAFSGAPDTVYVIAGEPSRLYVTRDGGRSFCPVAVPAPAVQAIYAAVAHPEVLYVVTGGGPADVALLRSLDGGGSWARLAADGLPATPMGWQLVVHPRRPSVLLAGPRIERRSGPGQLMRSEDGGVTWQPFADALATSVAATPPGMGPPSGVLGVPAFAPDGTIVYVSVYLAPGKSLLAWSDDDGLTWHTVDGPFKGFMDPSELGTPLIDQAGTLYLSGHAGLFRTRDRGASWATIPEGRGQLAVDAEVAGRLYAVRADSARAVLARSTDGGDTWAESAVPGGEDAAAAPLLFGAVGGTRVYLYLASAGLLASSSDGGLSVDPRKRLLLGPEVAVWPGRPDWVLAGQGAGAIVSRDGARSWSPLPLPGNAAAGSLAASAQDPDTAYVVARAPGAAGGIAHRSRDGGQTWRALAALDDVQSLTVAPGASGRVFVATTANLLRSDNGGDTWQRAFPDCALGALAVAPSRPSTMYALCHFLATLPSETVLASEDAGATWTMRGIDPTGLAAFSELRLAVDPSNPERLFAAGHGLHVSADGGRRWAPLIDRHDSVGAFLVHPAEGGALYAVREGRLLKSPDGSAPWLDLGIGGQSLAADPRDRGVLYVGTAGGLFVTRTAGSAP